MSHPSAGNRRFLEFSWQSDSFISGKKRLYDVSCYLNNALAATHPIAFLTVETASARGATSRHEAARARLTPDASLLGHGRRESSLIPVSSASAERSGKESVSEG